MQRIIKSSHENMMNRAILRASRSANGVKSNIAPMRYFGAAAPPSEPDQFINLTFMDMHGESKTIEARCGDSIFTAAMKGKVGLMGACNGSGEAPNKFTYGPSCGTCMVYLPDEYLMNIKELQSDEANTLRKTRGVNNSARLGCCVEVVPELDGATIGLPENPSGVGIEYMVNFKPEEDPSMKHVVWQSTDPLPENDKDMTYEQVMTLAYPDRAYPPTGAEVRMSEGERVHNLPTDVDEPLTKQYESQDDWFIPNKRF